MTKAKFIEEQPEVKMTERDGMYYIFICLNGEWKEEKMSDTTERFWECDYNEIVTDDIDVEDVKENPESYIDYDFRDSKGAIETRLSTLLKAKKITKDERDFVLTGKKSLSLSRQAVSLDEPIDVEARSDEDEAGDLR
jgi:hypothetical protein